MKVPTFLKEEEAKKYHIAHKFEVHKGDNRVITEVKITVIAASEEEAKATGDEQLEKLMAYMRSGTAMSSSSQDVEPTHSVQTDRPSSEEHEEEEIHPQSATRDFWQSKGFKDGKRLEGGGGSLSDFSEAEKDAMFLAAVNGKKEITNNDTNVDTKEVITEKSKSEKQARTMAAIAHGWKPKGKGKKKINIPKDVAKEFNKADEGTKRLSNAMKHNKKKKSPKEKVKEAVEYLRTLKESKQPPKQTFVDFLINT